MTLKSYGFILCICFLCIDVFFKNGFICLPFEMACMYPSMDASAPSRQWHGTGEPRQCTHGDALPSDTKRSCTPAKDPFRHKGGKAFRSLCVCTEREALTVV